MDGHLVAVKVCVESFADQRMEVDGIAFDQYWLKSLNSHAVQRRCSVKQHWVVLDYRFQDIPHLFIFALQHLFRTFDRISVSQLLQLADNEGLIQLQRNLFRQTTVMQFERRADDNDTTGRVINTFAKQVFAEAALLALDHVGQ